MTDEDQDWVDALAGRAPEGSNRGVVREGLRLRELIQRNVHAPDVSVPERDARREAQLLERAQREGLLDPSQLTKRRRRLMRPTGIGGLALAASLACLAVALTFLLHGTPQTQHLRGAHEEVVRIEAADPTVLKMQILQELRAVGVTATGYEQLGVEGIDADLPEPVPPRVREVLTRHHVSVPSDGVLKIEITAPSAP